MNIYDPILLIVMSDLREIFSLLKVVVWKWIRAKHAYKLVKPTVYFFLKVPFYHFHAFRLLHISTYAKSE